MKKREGSKPYAVIGLGRFGRSLASGLASAGNEVLVIDREEARIREAREYTENAFVTDDLSKSNLEQMGIGVCGTVVICIAEKLDVSLLTALNAVNLGVPRVIAKAVSAEHGALLERIGAEVVYPERDMGERLAKRLCASSVMEYISLSNDVDISEIRIPKKLVGVTVLDSRLRQRFSVNIIAIRRGGEIITHIRPDCVFGAEDTLLLIGASEDMARLMKELQ